MKKWWLIVLVFFACGYVTPLYANLPCEDGCEDECDCDDEKEEETENENDGGPGNDSPQSGSGGAKRGSVSIWVNWGGPANENIKGQYRLSIYAKKPTPMIYTPQIIQYRNLLLDRVNISEINQLYKQEIRGDRYASEGTIYSDGKVVRILSDGGGQEKIMTSLASDVTHLIKILAADREMMTFQFKDGSAVGTMIGETATMNYRLVMVDGSGNPTTTNPVYYDRYLGYGNFLRYSVETGNVVSYHTATGRIITPDAPTVGVEPIYEEDGTIRQVWSLGDGLADIVVTETAISYEIRCYSPDKVGAKVDGLYTVTGAPHTVWRIENPTPGTNTNVKVTKIVNGVAEVSLFEYSHNAEGWLFRKPGDLAIESETTSWDYSQTVKVVTTIEKTPEGQVASKVARTYQKYPFGDRIVNVSVDPDGVNLRTQTTYYTDSADSGSYGRKKTESFSDGNWVSYEYDNQGRKIATITPWKNAVFNSPATQARTEYFSYIPHDSRDIVESDDIRPRTEEIKILGITTSKTYHAYFFDGDEYVEIEERCVNSSAAYGDSSNLRIERRYYPKGDCSSPSAGRIHTIKYPDGTMDTYTYEYGTWTPNSDPAQSAFVAGTGVAVKVNITHGTVDAPQGIPNKTIRDSEVFDSRGCKVYWTQAVFTNNGYETYAWGANSFDESRRLISELESNNELTEYTWNCCNIASKILPDGTQYTYVYDSLNRLVSKTKIGVGEQPDLVINYTYDAANRKIAETITGGELSLNASWEYNLAGQLIKSINYQGLSNIYTYIQGDNQSSNPHGETVTLLLPDNSTVITETYCDGSIANISGSSQVAKYFDKGVNNDGSIWNKVNYAGGDSPRWDKQTSNLLGLPSRHEKSGYNGTVITDFFYNDKSQLIKETQTGKGTQLYIYNDIGNLYRTGIDIDNNGVLDISSNEPIIEQESYIDGVWEQQDIKVYGVHESATPTLIATYKRRLSGWGNNLVQELQSIDVWGNVKTTKQELDRANKTVTFSVLEPSSTVANQIIFINGLKSSMRNKNNLVTTYSYDSLERIVTITEPRIGNTTISYHVIPGKMGLLASITDSADNTTMFDYDVETGRLLWKKNALNQYSRYAYNSRGELTHLWGDAEYPTKFGYDQYGQRITMETFRTGEDWGSASWPNISGDITSWDYDEASGVLLKKTDALNNSVIYTYSVDGKLLTRTWGRQNAGQPLVTTYNYNTIGQIIKIDYSDSTPTLSFSYNRLGNIETVTDAVGTRTFSYNPEFSLQTETITGIYDKEISYTYTSAGQKGNLKNIIIDDTNHYSFSYDDFGRLDEIVTPTGAFSYTRESNSNLISQITRPVNDAVTYTYESNRNLITQIANGSSEFSYQYDVLGRKTSVDRSGDSLVPLSDLVVFNYNSRGELTSAVSDKINNYNYQYSFDTIGNRLTSNTYNVIFDYTSNALNQYTAINQEQYSYDADGNMLTRKDWVQNWDCENRLSEIYNSTVKLTFKYDYLGRRIEKNIYSKVDGEWNLQKSNRFVYDQYKLIEELDALNNNQIIRKYYWQPSILGSDVPLAMTDAITNVSYFYNADANKNIKSLVNASGDVMAHYEYDPYGNLLGTAGSCASQNPFRFSSEYFDEETGLIYFNYRYYDPLQGRWLSRDPIEEAGGINLYCFVNNAPINFNDNLGLSVPISEIDGFTHIMNVRKLAEMAAKNCPDIAAYANCLIDKMRKGDDAIDKFFENIDNAVELLKKANEELNRLTAKDIRDNIEMVAEAIDSDVWENFKQETKIFAQLEQLEKSMGKVMSAVDVYQAGREGGFGSAVLTGGAKFAPPGVAQMLEFYSDGYAKAKKAIHNIKYFSNNAKREIVNASERLKECPTDCDDARMAFTGNYNNDCKRLLKK